MNNLKIAKDLMTAYDLDFKDEHWIPMMKPEKDLARKLYGAFMGGEFLSKMFSIHKVCDVDGCVNPLCHKPYLRLNMKDYRYQDLVEISDSINLAEFRAKGARLYLKEYNKDKIDFLKISMDQLHAAVFIKENENNGNN